MININTTVRDADLLNLKQGSEKKENFYLALTYAMQTYLVTNFVRLELWKKHKQISKKESISDV